MLIEDLQKVVSEDTLTADVADMYLKIYVAEIDWKHHISNLWSNLKNKNSDEQICKVLMKKSIACTTLLPSYDKTVIPENPHNLLFWISSWNQFNEKDWMDCYKKMVEQDIEIRKSRKKMLAYGVIDSIDYVPMTRQAFNWMYSKAEETKIINDDNKQEVIRKFQNLIKIYGGAVVCNVFVKHEKNIDKILNWRSGYFIEKEIHKIYTIEQMGKIKQTEISKIDSKHVKTLVKK
jgi:hypothetical protein